MSDVTDQQQHEWIPVNADYWEGEALVARRMYECKHCGNVRLVDGKNKPCRGKVYIRPRGK